jgi:hypothetical protein
MSGAYIFFPLACLQELDSRRTYFSVTIFDTDTDSYVVKACYLCEIRPALVADLY